MAGAPLCVYRRSNIVLAASRRGFVVRVLPACFIEMSRAFHQDCLLEITSPEAMAEGAIAGLNARERADLAICLDRLLAEGPTACKNAWNRSEASIVFRRVKDVVTLLRAVRARL